MLVLTRKEGERIVIDERIVIEVIVCSDGRVKMGITAPPDVRILRQEVLERIAAAAA